MSLAQEVRELANNNEQLTNEYIRAKRELEKNQKEVEKLEKKLELARQEKENKKEYERGLLKAVENDLINTFSRCFEDEGLENGYINLRLKSTRDEILQNVPENEIEARYIDENYEKILEKVKKIYKNDFEAKQELQEKMGDIYCNTDNNIIEGYERSLKLEKDNKTFDFLITLFSILIPLAVVGGIIAFFVWGYFYFAVPVLNG